MTDDEIRLFALSHGFTLLKQPDGCMDLSPYVYDFARRLMDFCTVVAEDAATGRCADEIAAAAIAQEMTDAQV